MVGTASGINATQVVNDVLSRGSAIDDAGFAVLYRHYHRPLANYAARRGSVDADGTADLAMFDGYKAIITGRLRERSEPAFRAYLYQATDGHIANDYRRGRLSTVEINDDLPLEGDHAEDVVDRLWLQSLIDQLTDAQRETIRGRFLLDLDAGEVGQLLDKDPNAVHQLQHRALKRLRNLILALALAAAAIVGILAVRELVSNELSVDTAPIERPSTPTTTTTTSPVGDDRGPGPNPAIGGDLDAVESESTPDPGESGAAPTTTASGPLGNSNTEVDSAATSTAAPPTAAPPTTSTAAPPTTPSSTTSTSAPTSLPGNQPLLVEPPNLCDSEQLNPTLWQHRLRTSPPNQQSADGFVPPAAVRFVDARGTVLHLVDTSGPMATGLTPDTHGGLSPGDPNGSVADYRAAQQPVFWGVLTTTAAVDGWTSIQYRLQDTTAWFDILNCG